MQYIIIYLFERERERKRERERERKRERELVSAVRYYLCVCLFCFVTIIHISCIYGGRRNIHDFLF